MANVRAVRYRRLALAEGDKTKAADLLLKLADECDRGILCTSEWLSARLRPPPSRDHHYPVEWGNSRLERLAAGCVVRLDGIAKRP
jgi:hypothetical protein